MSGLANVLHKTVVVSLMGLTAYATYVFTAGIMEADKKRKKALKELKEKVHPNKFSATCPRDSL